MLDLTKFTKEKEVIVPIVDGWGQFEGKKFRHKVEDCWYKIQLPSDIILKRASPLDVLETLEKKRKIQVYALGTEGIPLNFDNFKRKGLREAETIHFMSLPIFNVATAVLWEDNRLYFYEHIIPKGRDIIKESKEAFRRGQGLLDLRGITPELRYYVLLASLQRQTYESLQSISRSSRFGGVSDRLFTKQLDELKQHFDVRLKHAVESAGATYIGYSKRGNGYTVEWEIDGERIKSDIRDDMRIITAGFCLSGDDKKHTMNSIVQLAKLFTEEQFLNVTRQ